MITEAINTHRYANNHTKNLEQIHEKEINIAVYDRKIDFLTQEIITLLDHNIELRASGDTEEIFSIISNELLHFNCFFLLTDIEQLLLQFSEISNAKSFRLLLATINTDMCRKFHTDINDLRLLCTYSGPGTLWLTEDNINHKALVSNLDNDSIVLDESRIQQAKTGSVIILKGAIYPKEGTSPIVHRSPTIEETGQKRLLLRIDTNEFLNFG